MNQENQNINNNQEQNNQEAKQNIFTNVKDDSETFTQQEKESGKIVAILSYVGIVGLIMYLIEQNNQFARYHAKQGANLFVIEAVAGIIVAIISGIMSAIYNSTDVIIFSIFSALLSAAVSIVSLVLMVIGIMNAANGKAKELPIVGKFKIFK